MPLRVEEEPATEADLFGVDFNGAHDALEDVRATVRCFVALRKDLVGLGPSI